MVRSPLDSIFRHRNTLCLCCRQANAVSLCWKLLSFCIFSLYLDETISRYLDELSRDETRLQVPSVKLTAMQQIAFDGVSYKLTLQFAPFMKNCHGQLLEVLL